MSATVHPVQDYPFHNQGLRDENKTVEQFRNYETSDRDEIVRQTYRLHHVNQTYDYVQERKQKFLQFKVAKLTVWQAIEKLDTLVDESDPDTDLPQIMHALQTAESLREMYPEHDWLHLIGLIHDLGKVLALPEWGSEPQWAVVGDTFPVGLAYSDTIVHNQFLKENEDYMNPKYNTKYGVYSPNCGLDNVHFTWGHDEYMYQVCLKNNCKIPPQGLACIRYHSCYPWHNGGAYRHIMDESDEEKLVWVLKFNKADLYSKNAKTPDVEKLKPYYQGLVEKYFPNPVLEW
eukprot:TRINITY_DN3984_c0_g1_i1.p1 TRINITY_DN3984_c0_g1~~TRINITY_DN3984_c0_g1_i1.p1  ORF type:complete len:289 (-),score=82.61 TRINITY_DN3984_c0_g1_i1:126-992(-)